MFHNNRFLYWFFIAIYYISVNCIQNNNSDLEVKVKIEGLVLWTNYIITKWTNILLKTIKEHQCKKRNTCVNWKTNSIEKKLLKLLGNSLFLEYKNKPHKKFYSIPVKINKTIYIKEVGDKVTTCK